MPLYHAILECFHFHIDVRILNFYFLVFNIKGSLLFVTLSMNIPRISNLSPPFPRHKQDSLTHAHFFRQEREETLFLRVIILIPAGEDFLAYQIWLLLILRPTEDGLSRSTGNLWVNDGNEQQLTFIFVEIGV